jgi:hypothetical protein
MVMMMMMMKWLTSAKEIATYFRFNSVPNVPNDF